jgi:hypothetical protein
MRANTRTTAPIAAVALRSMENARPLAKVEWGARAKGPLAPPPALPVTAEGPPKEPRMARIAAMGTWRLEK